MVPVVSTVTWTSSGRSAPVAARARRAPITEDLVWSRSWVVSTRMASAPPAIRPSTFFWYASRSAGYGAWPSVGSLVPGPTEPSTQRGRPSAANSSATSRAMRAPASESSKMRSGMSYSPRAARLAPKVLVSTQSTPTEKYSWCTERTMSGRVTLRISLQPSRFWKSSRLGSCAWSIVPIAPSATTTREARASRSSAARAALAEDGDFTAMELLPGLRRLSALRLPVDGAPGQGSGQHKGRYGRPTRRTAPGRAAVRRHDDCRQGFCGYRRVGIDR